MNLYDKYINELLAAVDIMKAQQGYRTYNLLESSQWNKVDQGCLVLTNEVAVELGHPRKESLSLLMPTSTPGKVEHGRITVLGRDLKECKNKSVSFAKILLLETAELEETDAFDKLQKAEQVRHMINLDGYMLRAANQSAKEWSRVSNKALSKGFSFQILGSELINAYKQLDYIRKAELIFITEHDNLIKSLLPIGEKIIQVTQALNKIFDNLEFDCDACNFHDVCDEIDGLKKMHGKSANNQ